jgi:hypothetical protein
MRMEYEEVDWIEYLDQDVKAGDEGVGEEKRRKEEK